jgi:hypothetical protein
VELQTLKGGLADTSTLIYLERLDLLSLAARSFSLRLIPQVTTEYGANPQQTVLVPVTGPGTTDELLCRTAQILGIPVLSEDKQVLRRARMLGLSFYNTLMLLLALCAQGYLSIADFPPLRDRLCSFARYGPEVVAIGDAVYGALLQSPQMKQQ